MRSALLSIAWASASAACRIGFDDLPRGGDAGPPADAFGTCDPAAPFGAPVAIAELNDPAAEDGTLRLSRDELSGYFWSARGNGSADLYYASRPALDQPFSFVPASALNTAAPDLDPTVNSDGTLIAFRHSQGGDRLFVATRTGPTTFGTPSEIGSNISTGAETQPYFRPGSDELYFDSHRSGNGDLYRATHNGTTFTSATLVAGIATTADEGDPVVTADGLTLYFRSNRAGANALFNIWTASRATTADAFGTPSEVPNVSSDANDGPSDISADGCRLYISSDRAGTNDIYVSTRSKPAP